MARMKVVFPAPFGPSRPATPGPNEHDSSVRATFGPNHTETPRASTVASGTNAGSLESVAGLVVGSLTGPPTGND